MGASAKRLVYMHTPRNLPEYPSGHQLISKKQPEHRILFLKSWNEWGEGNYVEPDQQFGHGYLDAIRNAIENNKSL